MNKSKWLLILAGVGIGAVAALAIYRPWDCSVNGASELPDSDDAVDTASNDSFPASDPPAWTGSGIANAALDRS